MKLSLSLQLNSPRFGVSYNPLDIPSMGEWFDYRVLAGTSDGAPVGSWEGRKGLYTAASDGTERPTFVGDAGDGKGALLFDGVNDRSYFNATNADLYGPDGYFEMWCVVKIPASVTVDSQFFLSGFGTGTAVSATDNPVSTRWTFGGSGLFSYLKPQDTHDDVWHVLRFVTSPGGVTWFVDGEEIGVDATLGDFSYNAGSTTAFIGNSVGTWNGMLRHFLTFKSPLDADTAAALTSYLTTA